MRWLRVVSLTCALAVAVTACVLRPRYQDLTRLSPGDGPIVVAVVDDATGAPLAEVPVSIGEGQNRLSLRTDAQGRVTIPRDDRFGSLNALVVVDKPKGIARYRFEPVAASEAPKPSGDTEGASGAHEDGVPRLIPDGGVGPGQPPGGAPPTRGGEMMDTTVGDAGTPASSTSAQ